MVPQGGMIFFFFPNWVLASEEVAACLHERLQTSGLIYTLLLRHICNHMIELLNKVHLPNLKWSIKQFGVPRGSVGKFPSIVFWADGARKVGTFVVYSTDSPEFHRKGDGLPKDMEYNES